MGSCGRELWVAESGLVPFFESVIEKAENAFDVEYARAGKGILPDLKADF